jgi:hypothetical protein
MQRAPKPLYIDLEKRFKNVSREMTETQLKWQTAADEEKELGQRLVALTAETRKVYVQLRVKEKEVKNLRAQFTELQENIKTIAAEVDADIKVNEEQKQMDEAELRERLEAQRNRIAALEAELARLKAEKSVDAVAKPSSVAPKAVGKVVSKTPDEVTTDENDTTDGNGSSDDDQPIAKLQRGKPRRFQVESDSDGGSVGSTDSTVVKDDVAQPEPKGAALPTAKLSTKAGASAPDLIVVQDDVAQPEPKGAALPTARLSTKAGASKPKAKRARSDKPEAASARKRAKTLTKSAELFAESAVEDGTQRLDSQEIDDFFAQHAKP